MTHLWSPPPSQGVFCLLWSCIRRISRNSHNGKHEHDEISKRIVMYGFNICRVTETKYPVHSTKRSFKEISVQLILPRAARSIKLCCVLNDLYMFLQVTSAYASLIVPKFCWRVARGECRLSWVSEAASIFPQTLKALHVMICAKLKLLCEMNSQLRAFHNQFQ